MRFQQHDKIFLKQQNNFWTRIRRIFIELIKTDREITNDGFGKPSKKPDKIWKNNSTPQKPLELSLDVLFRRDQITSNNIKNKQ